MDPRLCALSLAVLAASVNAFSPPRDPRRTRPRQAQPAQSASAGGSAYIDDTTAYCYKRGLATGWGDSMLDTTYEESIARKTIKRPNTRLWCTGPPWSFETPPDECENHGPPAADATQACIDSDNNCARGYDLLQTPPGATCNTPRVLYIHGGSWWGGSPWSDSYAVHTSKIAKETGAIVLSIDYPLIAGWAWPLSKKKYMGQAASMLEFATDAWEWLASHGPHGKACNCVIQKPPMFLAGDSSGAGTAISLLMDLRRKEREGSLGGLRFPSGGFFESPWTNLACDSGTYYSNNFAAYPNLTIAAANPRQGTLTGDVVYNDVSADSAVSVSNPWSQTLEFAVNALQYCGCDVSYDISVLPATCDGHCGTSSATEDQLTNTIFSPYHASEDEMRGLPPLYFATSATELIAGDTSVLAEKAAKAGVIARSELFYGMWHTFPQYSEGCGGGSPAGTLWQGVAALQHFGDFVREVAKAAKRCPWKLRTTDGGNWMPAKAESMAVNNLHELAGENATGPLVTIPPLDLDICGSGGRSPLKGEEAALAEAEATGGRKRRKNLRRAARVTLQADDEASALLQTSLEEEFGEELGEDDDELHGQDTGVEL